MHYRNDNKDWVELESNIEKPEIFKQIFNNLGFEIDVIVDKTRKVYKKEKNFEEADKIRKELMDKGIMIKDTREGSVYEIVK